MTSNTSNLDDFLGSMSINTEEINNQEEVIENTAINLSENDFNNILSDMGFVEASEESTSDNSNWEEYHENQEEGRDLDAEEDGDWQELIDSGGIVPVETETIQDEETPTTQEATDTSIQQDASAIPQNSATFLIDDSTSRFSGTEWYNAVRNSKIILAGLGGIGSWTALQLARLSPTTMLLYDDDRVETANMSGQMFSLDNIGQTKVDAIADTLSRYTSTPVFAVCDRFTSQTQAGDIMICGFDNMSARKTFFNSWMEHVMSKPVKERKLCLYLDGRLNIDILQVFCITGDNEYAQKEYESKYLFNDSEADATVCSMKQTTYLACMIGSFITNLFINHIANLQNPIIPYDLPFFTEYDAKNMIFKTLN